MTDLGKNERPYLRKSKAKRTEVMDQVVENLPGKNEALNSKPQ
jgi:hypothetical protein